MAVINVSEAEGAVLDRLVAKSLGAEVKRRGRLTNFGEDMELCDWLGEPVNWWADSFHPSTDWSQGGPLAERLTYIEKFPGTTEPWVAWVCEASPGQCGDTLLIALCRAIVAVELGDTVDVPDEPLEACNG